MLPRKTLSVSRPSGGNREQETAKWIPGEPVALTIQASVQPLRPFEVMSLPEGRRTRSAYNLFTDTKLQTVDQDNPDQVTINGVVFEVISVASWQNGIIPHYKCVVSQMEIQPS